MRKRQLEALVLAQQELISGLREDMRHFASLAAARGTTEFALAARQKGSTSPKLQPHPLVDLPEGYDGPVVPLGL